MYTVTIPTRNLQPGYIVYKSDCHVFGTMERTYIAIVPTLVTDVYVHREPSSAEAANIVSDLANRMCQIK